jgi:hypothetical protein
MLSVAKIVLMVMAETKLKIAMTSLIAIALNDVMNRFG